MSDKIKNNLITRPPVVVVMGHIDHGKTTLLDSIRKTNVVARESGGITQHINAYEIIITSTKPEIAGRKITFVDTPGHEAFSKMRARGAQMGDIAILVVAADEGIKPQTLESLKQIQESKTPYLVAINKIDKPEANIERTKQQLAENGVYLEGWGGHVPFVAISAKEGKNIDELLEMIALMADMEELKAEQGIPASGFVIEAKMDSRRGSVVMLIIKNGFLKVGDEIATCSANGKIKILEDFKGTPISEAIFSAPVKVIGFKDLPKVGEEFCVGSINILAMAENNQLDAKKEFPNAYDPDEKVIRTIIKADVAGSLEALDAIIKNSTFGEWHFEVLDSGVGEIMATDIQNAQATGSWILGFHTKIARDLESIAKNNDVKIFLFDIVYEFEKFFKQEVANIVGLVNKKPEGECQILACFSKGKKERTVGGKVVKGKLVRGNQIQIMRGEEVLGVCKILNIQCQKKDVREVIEGKEAGFVLETNIDIKAGDIITLA